jgi:hypothetical protein
LVSSSGLALVVIASMPRVREVAYPKCRCAGAGRPRWILESPAVPSRARANRLGRCGERCLLGVGDELSVDDVRDPPLQSAQRFERGLASGAFASVVGTTFGVEADLDDGGDVEHVVHPSVPRP